MNRPSTQLIEATSCVERLNATIKADDSALLGPPKTCRPKHVFSESRTKTSTKTRIAMSTTTRWGPGSGRHRRLGTKRPHSGCPPIALRRGGSAPAPHHRQPQRPRHNNQTVCVFWASGSGGSLVITRYQSLPLTPGKVLPICVTQ